MNSELPAVINPVLSALLNGCYQGLVLAGLVWLVAKALRGINAATRYAIWLATLLIVAALPIAHLVCISSQLSASESIPSLADSKLAETPMPGTGWTASSQDSSPQKGENGTPVVARNDDALASESLVLPSSPSSRLKATMAAAAAALQPIWASLLLRPRWESILPGWASVGLFAFWLLVVTFRLARLALSCRSLCALKQRACSAPRELESRFQSILAAMKLSRPTQLKLSATAASPVAAGFFHPVVLLPAKLAVEIEPEGMDLVFRHELAHLRRRDDWSNLAQQIIKAVFFFHPGVWWLSRRLDNDREVACDDHVLAVAARREPYALLLTELASQRGTQASALAPAAWNTKSQIEERITMILDKTRNATTATAPVRAGALTITMLLLAAGAFQFAPRLALAQEAAATPIAEAPAISAKPAQSAVQPTPRAKEKSERNGIVVSSESEDIIEKPRTTNKAENKATARSERKDRNLEDRLARLEEQVEKLLARDRSNKSSATVSVRPRAEGKGEEEFDSPSRSSARSDKRSVTINKDGNTLALVGPGALAGPSALPKGHPPLNKFDLNLPEAKAQARSRLEHTRRELAERRTQLQAELEAVRSALKQIEADLKSKQFQLDGWEEKDKDDHRGR